ncbi:Zn-dependent exopeptidase, partial [Corynespora cassiicola Philippines]
MHSIRPQSRRMTAMSDSKAGSPAPSLASLVDRFRPDLAPFEDFYRDLHQHPELPTKEVRTVSLVAAKLKQLGYSDVIENIGGHGIVAILRNGPGRTALVRSELDALPIREEAKLPYSSTVRMEDSWGVERPVMHACAHDMHATCLLAASSLLLAAKQSWSGTLLVLFQPNEEWLGGAQAM